MSTQTDRHESPRPTIRQRISCCAGLCIVCMASVFLVAVLPIHLIWSNASPPDWGTESEAICFPENIMNERFERPRNEKND